MRRRSFIATLSAAATALALPRKAKASPRYIMAVDPCTPERDHFARYIWIIDPKAGAHKMYSYSIDDGPTIKLKQPC